MMNELENRLKDFEKTFYGKDIEIRLDDFLIGKIIFYNANIQYDKESGFLKLLSKINEESNSLEFNTLDINYIDYSKDKLELGFDNSQIIRILKK